MIAVVFSSLEWMSVELCACSVVDNDCRCNCVHVQQYLMIDGKIVVVFSSL